MTLDEKAQALSEESFIGFQPQDFDQGGREQFIYLLNQGLTPQSKVIDLGCGVLRAGYWLIHFLEKGHYFGIEPHQGRLEMGMQRILEPLTLEGKKPQFDTNPDFNTSVFNESFDFFLLYSIWTHACKRQVQATLDSFVRDAAPGATFLTSYLPADEAHPDYLGDEWVGTSHESTQSGCIHHDSQWLYSECESRHLVWTELEKDKTYGMNWLAIQKG